MTWAPDARLTPLGHSQAAAAREAWKAEIRHGIVVPQRFYVSPLRRALETWTDTFGGTGDDAVLPGNRRTVTVLEVSPSIRLVFCVVKSLTWCRIVVKPMGFILAICVSPSRSYRESTLRRPTNSKLTSPKMTLCGRGMNGRLMTMYKNARNMSWMSYSANLRLVSLYAVRITCTLRHV